MNATYFISVIQYTCIIVMAVCGSYLVTGLTGFFSLGQSAFMALGAYTSSLLMKELDLPFPIALAAACVMGLIAGYIISKPTLKLKRDYFSLVTFGFTTAIIAILNSARKLTGGGMGLSGIPKHTSTALLVISMLVVLFLVRNFKYSRLGRQCMAIRTDELAAKAMGINTDRAKITVFLLSASITAYAGALYASYLRYIDPTMFTWNNTAEWIIIVFVGGTGSLTGSFLTAIILTALPELLHAVEQYRIIIYSAIVLIIVAFRPKGIFGEFEFFPRKYAYVRSQLETKALKKGAKTECLK